MKTKEFIKKNLLSLILILGLISIVGVFAGDMMFTESQGLDIEDDLIVNGKVGIGTSTPQTSLDIRKTHDFLEGDDFGVASISKPHLALVTTDAQASGRGGSIGFGGKYNADSEVLFGAIAGKKSTGSSGARDGYLAFYTNKHGSGLQERMRIDNAGNIRINGELRVTGISGSGSVVCMKSDGNLGTCTNAPNANGDCTCA